MLNMVFLFLPIDSSLPILSVCQRIWTIIPPPISSHLLIFSQIRIRHRIRQHGIVLWIIEQLVRNN